MLRNYLVGYLRHNRASAIALSALSFIAATLLGLVIGVCHLLVADYIARMDYLGESPSVTGSGIAFAVVTTISVLSLVLMLKSAFGISMSERVRQLGIVANFINLI